QVRSPARLRNLVSGKCPARPSSHLGWIPSPTPSSTPGPNRTRNPIPHLSPSPSRPRRLDFRPTPSAPMGPAPPPWVRWPSPQLRSRSARPVLPHTRSVRLMPPRLLLVGVSCETPELALCSYSPAFARPWQLVFPAPMRVRARRHRNEV